jgi:hypothetical protein
MSTELARAIVYLITTVGALVWVTALLFLIHSVPKRPGGTGVSPVPLGSTEVGRLEKSPDAVPEGLIASHAEIPGTPADLSAKAAAVLAKEQLKIVQRTDERVVFEGAGPVLASAVGQFVRRGELRFSPTGSDRTAVDYAIAVPEARWLLTLGGVFQALGLVTLVALFFVITTWVIPSPNPAIRIQSFQMLQAIHFLWPPFLFGGVYRVRRRAVQARFEVLVHNLPYFGA